MYFLCNVIFTMLHFIFSLCCIIKSSLKNSIFIFMLPLMFVLAKLSTFLPFSLHVVHKDFISLFQWLCHELCNLLLCTSFTAIMSWIQNGHSCPLFLGKYWLPFLIISDPNEWSAYWCTHISSITNLKCGTFSDPRYLYFSILKY